MTGRRHPGSIPAPAQPRLAAAGRPGQPFARHRARRHRPPVRPAPPPARRWGYGVSRRSRPSAPIPAAWADPRRSDAIPAQRRDPRRSEALDPITSVTLDPPASASCTLHGLQSFRALVCGFRPHPNGAKCGCGAEPSPRAGPILKRVAVAYPLPRRGGVTTGHNDYFAGDVTTRELAGPRWRGRAALKGTWRWRGRAALAGMGGAGGDGPASRLARARPARAPGRGSGFPAPAPRT